MYKKIKNYLDRNPGLYMVIVFAVFAARDIYGNISEQRPIWYDMQGTLAIGFTFLLAYGIYLAKLKKPTQAVISFSGMFSYLMISGWVDESSVAFTSVIEVMFFSLFCTLFLMLIIGELEKDRQRSK